MADSKTRVGGSGWTTFRWRGNTLAWLQTISDQAAKPVATPRPIQPIGAEHPVEILTPRAIGAGTLKLSLYELWNGSVWNQLSGLSRANSILDVFKQQVSLGEVSCRKIIKTPSGGQRAKVYYGCTVTDIDDSETISIETMEMPKGITIMYTHTNVV